MAVGTAAVDADMLDYRAAEEGSRSVAPEILAEGHILAQILVAAADKETVHKTAADLDLQK